MALRRGEIEHQIDGWIAKKFFCIGIPLDLVLLCNCSRSLCRQVDNPDSSTVLENILVRFSR
jgi:hypothetical protein